MIWLHDYIVLGKATLLLIRQEDDDRLPDESLAMFLQMQQGNMEQQRLHEPVRGPGHVTAGQDELIEVEEEEEAPEHDEHAGAPGYGVAEASWSSVKQEQWDDDEWEAWMKQEGYADDWWKDQKVKEEAETFPPWAYREHDRSRSRHDGMAGNVGRADKMGGEYTYEGWIDPSGKAWQSLVGVLVKMFTLCFLGFLVFVVCCFSVPVSS